MNATPRISPKRRVGSVLALAVLAPLAMLSFSRCQYAPDQLTGLDRAKPEPAGTCVSQCAKQYKDSLDAEQDLHEKNLELCRHGHGDGGDDDDRARFGAGRRVVSNGGGDGDGHGGGDGDGDGHGDGHGDGDGGADPNCIALEQARHEAAVARIREGRRECIDGCHHQGGGSGR